MMADKITVVLDDEFGWLNTRVYDSTGHEIKGGATFIEIAGGVDDMRTVKITFMLDTVITAAEYEKRKQ